MVQMLTGSLNVLRVQVMKKFKKISKKYRLLKSPEICTSCRQNSSGLHWHHKDNLTTPKQKVNKEACSEELNNTYNLLQSFYNAWAGNDSQAIKKVIQAKENVGRQIHQTLLTLSIILKL